MHLITPEYAALNAELHQRRQDYGTGGHKWASWVAEHCAQNGYRSVLDYGCGKGSLAAALPGMNVREYDPAVPGKDSLPAPAELVVCTDVLEHVEIECLDTVLTHLEALAVRSLLLGVSCREGGKKLADGRNAHITVHPRSWWAEKIRALEFYDQAFLPGPEDEFNVILRGRRG